MTQTQEQNMPALRFPEFSREWVQKRLQDVAVFQNGKAHEQNICSDGDFVVVNSKFISTEGRIKKFTNKQISPLFVDDIVMVMSDIPKGKALAKCYLIEKDDAYSLNQRICSLQAHDADPHYLFMVINRNDYFLKFDSGVTQTNLRKDEVLRCPAYFPTLPEQQKIAAFLSSVDSKIVQLGQKKALLQRYKKGVMQKLFSQELRFKGAQGNDFPDWEEKRLGEVATRRTEKNTELKYSRVLTNSAVRGIIDQGDYFDHAVANAENLGGYYVVESGDFVYNPRISVSAPVGPIKRNDLGAGVMSPLYSVFRFKTTDTAFYEQYFLSSFWYRYMKSVANYGARHDRMAISTKDFMNMPLPHPCPGEQQKIADFLSAIDRKIDLVATELDHAKTFKKGLLQQMFI